MSLESDQGQPTPTVSRVSPLTTREAILIALVALLAALIAWKPADLIYDTSGNLSMRKLSFEKDAPVMSHQQRFVFERQQMRYRLMLGGIFTAAWAGIVCGAIGAALGTIRRGTDGVGIGFLSATGIGLIMGFLGGAAGEWLQDQYRILPYQVGWEALARAILFQSAAFIAFSVAVFAVFVLWAPIQGRKLPILVGVVVAAAISSLAYLEAAALISPLATTWSFVPTDSICRLIWVTAPALMVSLTAGMMTAVPQRNVQAAPAIEPAPTTA